MRVHLAGYYELCVNLCTSDSAEHLHGITEVPRSGERLPSRTFYLWSVRIEDIVTKLKHDMYRGVFNLLTRLRAERKKNLDLMDDKIDEEDLRGEDFERFKTFQQREMRLENSIQHLLYSLLSLSQYVI